MAEVNQHVRSRRDPEKPLHEKPPNKKAAAFSSAAAQPLTQQTSPSQAAQARARWLQTTAVFAPLYRRPCARTCVHRPFCFNGP